MRPRYFVRVILALYAVALGLGACAATTPASRPQGKVDGLNPSWSASAYASQDRDDAWHFAYAVQSWAGEQNGHVVMVPARYTIVADRVFFGDESATFPCGFARRSGR